MLFSNILKASKTIVEDVWESGDFTDVTLATSDDHQIKVHKLILSANSKLFRNILLKNQEQNQVVYLMGIKYRDLANLLKFVYLGKCEVEEENIPSFLSLAKELDVSGLEGRYCTENTGKNDELYKKQHSEFVKEQIEIPKTNDFHGIVDDSIKFKEEEETKESMMNKAKHIEVDHDELLFTTDVSEDQNDEKRMKYLMESNETKGISDSLIYISK